MASKDEILAERVAFIEADPRRVALSAITDLGTCAGRGGLQKAVDIASAALEADFEASARGVRYDARQPHCWRLAYLREFADRVPGVDLRSALDCADAAYADDPAAEPVEAAQAEADEWRRAS